ncbi:hypothetical protein BGW38_006697, partial [Lunasporangiospora selenospora]
MTSETSMSEELEMVHETSPHPNPFVFVPAPCRGESSKAASARARAKSFVFVPSSSFYPTGSSTTPPTVAKKRGRPKGSTKVIQATINRGKGKQKANDDGDDILNNSDANTNNPASCSATINPTNNNTIHDLAASDTTNDPVNDNTVNGPAVINAENHPPTISQTDLYSVLGPGRVDRFYADGCLFGYDSNYLGEPSIGNSRDRPPGENENGIIVEDEQEVQEERLIEEETGARNINGPIPGEDDEEEKVYHDGPRPFDETNYPLHFFYEHYFAQFPVDNTTNDTDSDYSDSSEDDEEEEEEDTTAETTHIHTSAKRKAHGCSHLSVKRSRLDQCTRSRPRWLDDTEDVEELQQHRDQDQFT